MSDSPSRIPDESVWLQFESTYLLTVLPRWLEHPSRDTSFLENFEGRTEQLLGTVVEPEAAEDRSHRSHQAPLHDGLLGEVILVGLAHITDERTPKQTASMKKKEVNDGSGGGVMFVSAA